MDLLLRRHKTNLEIIFSASHLEAFKRIQAIGIRLKGKRKIETIDSRRLLAESTNGMADHSLYEDEVFHFKTSLISLTLYSYSS